MKDIKELLPLLSEVTEKLRELADEIENQIPTVVEQKSDHEIRKGIRIKVAKELEEMGWQVTGTTSYGMVYYLSNTIEDPTDPNNLKLTFDMKLNVDPNNVPQITIRASKRTALGVVVPGDMYKGPYTKEWFVEKMKDIIESVKAYAPRVPVSIDRAYLIREGWACLGIADTPSVDYDKYRIVIDQPTRSFVFEGFHVIGTMQRLTCEIRSKCGKPKCHLGYTGILNDRGDLERVMGDMMK